MSEHIYRVTEIVGSSTESVDAAIRNGLHRAGRTLRKLDWFEVTQIRGHLKEGEAGQAADEGGEGAGEKGGGCVIAHYQVGLKVGFRLEEEGPGGD
ncbi:dodecin [Streptomyces hoynatensis]|uniref:Dodecin domain-containing protein n=1 Tax=Streptomyces hoynatensis TaxID=1141874 RepID=A0A3A9YUP2_9ACTN|nr:dodecin [Streptomyces hoynatensis]RKN38947.1 dodecin domain-containing protein [Streptomyces hoynatensis]